MNCENNYQSGSIRIVFGLILILGAVGAIESTLQNTNILTSLAVAATGMYSLYSGVTASNS